MTIIWARAESSNVFDALGAVEQALTQVETTPPAAVQTEDLFMGDGYLAENVGVLRETWSIDPWRVAAGGVGVIGRAFDLGQRVVRRLTWWYALPQWQQISQFNGAVVRSTDAILARVLRLAARIHELESAHSEPRLRGVEEQLRAAREEQQALLRRVADLEAQLAVLRATKATRDTKQAS